jgi:hypothetical protein
VARKGESKLRGDGSPNVLRSQPGIIREHLLDGAAGRDLLADNLDRDPSAANHSAGFQDLSGNSQSSFGSFQKPSGSFRNLSKVLRNLWKVLRNPWKVFRNT